MKMKLKYILACCLLVGLTSCFRDKSSFGENPVSEIKLIENGLKETYNVDRGDVFTISAPITSTDPSKALKYEWEVDHKLVSEKKELNYQCKEFGKFPVRLKVSNGDQIKYFSFNLDVQYAYLNGLYILGQKDAKMIMSYLPENDKKPFRLDILAPNNEKLDFTAKPTTMQYLYNKTYKRAMFYVATDNPSNLYRFEANLMTSSLKIDPKGVITAMGTEKDDSNVYAISGGSIKKLGIKSTSFVDVSSQHKKELKIDKMNLASAMTCYVREDLRYAMGIVLFNNEDGRLLLYGGKTRAKARPLELFPDTFRGMKLISMVPTDKTRQVALFLEKTDTKEIYHYLVAPGFYNSSKVENDIQASIKYDGLVADNVGLTVNSKFVSAPNRDLLYYSNANKLYGYSTLSNGNFEGNAIFSCAEGEVIADMFVTTDETKLFIATNSPTGEMKGNIYCLDIADNANKLLWEKKALTGEIVKLYYREK